MWERCWQCVCQNITLMHRGTFATRYNFSPFQWSRVWALDPLTAFPHHDTRILQSLIKELDISSDISEWKFVFNRKNDLRQQDNGYDYGVFICCCSVANRGAMIYDSNISSLGNLMLLDLHQRRLYPLPFEGIQLKKYYITSKYCLIKHLKTSERQMNLHFDCCPNFSFEGS